MAKALIESLQLDLPALAKIIQAKGRKGDTILAHINPREAALLKRRGGSGTINPETGLPQFDEGVDVVGPTYSEMGYTPPPEQAGPPVQFAAPDVQAGYTGSQYGGQAPISADVSAAQPQAPVTNQTFANTQAAEDLAAGNAYGVGTVPTGQALPTSGTAYAPTTLTPIQLGQAALGQQVEGYPGPTTTTPTAPTTPPKEDSGKLLDTLTRLGLAGGLGLYGAGQYKKGVAQTQAATGQQQAIAQPYQTAGQNLVRAASAGELTPQSVQSYKALQAQLAQGVANRGGVGAEQAANQLEAFRQTLLTNQYNYGLQVSQIGDQIALGAIRTGMQLDQQLNQASTNFYTSLAGIAAGLPMARTV